MTPLQAALIGLLQGIFEWLPVSSEAVITLTMTQIYGSNVINSLNSAVWVHTGTMLAAATYFRHDITRMVEKSLKRIDQPVEVFKDPEIRFVFISTMMTGLVGGTIYFVGKGLLDGQPELFSVLTAVALVLTGFSRFLSSGNSRNIGNLKDADSIVTGFLQGFSIVPGISRSGSTVFALLARNFHAREAFRLSFLMSIPAVLAANIGLKIFSGFTVTPSLMLAAFMAFLSGYASIGVVLKLADRTEVSLICFVLAALSLVPVLI